MIPQGTLTLLVMQATILAAMEDNVGNETCSCGLEDDGREHELELEDGKLVLGGLEMHKVLVGPAL